MSVGKEIFGTYLEKHHDEMVEEFKKTDVNGRIFGVQVLALNAKQYMDEKQSLIVLRGKYTCRRIHQKSNADTRHCLVGVNVNNSVLSVFMSNTLHFMKSV